MTPSFRRPALPWLALTLAWTAQMSVFSTPAFSSEHTQSSLAALLALCHIHLAPPAFHLLHAAIRKLSHAGEYLLFTLLLYRTLAGPGLAWRPSFARLCLAAAALYSLLDEFHQVFAPGRGPSLRDAAIDTAGALLALLLLYYRSRLSRAPASLNDSH